ncbi:MAG: sigma-70 family RNA polymerase sigma factor [Pirellulales bacterium]|nr:sigma-70 family RNA polymerase sigma factor [Pirellulales bacterium]
MAFPNTRHTLIQRLVSGGEDEDWRNFPSDYWGPVCRFAMRRGTTSLEDAEDIASTTFEVVFRKELLQQWVNSPQAKLRTLLCNIVNRVQANKYRAERRKADFQKKLAQEISQAREDADSQQQDAFTAAWVEELLQQCLQRLAQEYHAAGKGDYFRVLYGRLCEQLSIAEVSEALEISRSAVDNYYRNVRRRLQESLQSAVRSHVYRYCPVAEAEDEFVVEWGRLEDHLRKHGGLEDALRKAHQSTAGEQLQTRKRQGIRDTLTRISSIE